MDPDNAPEKLSPLIESSQSATEGTSCPICFTPCTSSGEHRLSCLPCGHIYGKRYVLTATRTFYPCRHLSDARSCLAQWLREKKFCPHCKAKVRKSSAVIQLYAPNARVVAVEGESTSEVRIRQLQEELKTMREHNKRLLDDKKSLTQQIAFLNKAIPAPPAANNSNVAALTAALVDVHATLPLHDLRVELHHVMRVPKVRSVAQCQSRDVLLMSIEEHKTGRGGVLKMSLSDPSSTQVTWCHDKMIGMIKVHPNLPQYLTASQDHTVKCHSLDSMQTLVTWSCPGPVWSVEWDHDHDQLCYVGLGDGSLLVFDTCHTAAPRLTVTAAGKQPLQWLYYIRAHTHPAPHANAVAKHVYAGLFGASTKCCYFWDKNALLKSHVVPVPLKLAAVPDIAHVAWEPSTASVVLSLVKCAEWPRGCHVIGQFSGTPSAPLQLLRTYQPSCEPKRLSHVLQIALPSGAVNGVARSELLMVASDEDKRQVLVYHVNSGRDVQRMEWQSASDLYHNKVVAHTLDLTGSVNGADLDSKTAQVSASTPSKFVLVHNYVLPSPVDLSYYGANNTSAEHAGPYLVALSDHYLAVYRITPPRQK